VGSPCVRRDSPSLAVGSLASGNWAGYWRRRLPCTTWSASLLGIAHYAKSSNGPPRLLGELLILRPSSTASENGTCRGFLASNTTELRHPAHVFR
jgi:hypothetical protein